jgi:hypothetical protein
MPDESAARENQRLAYEIKTKYEYWLVGLIFAVLALAVETATFDGPRAGQVCELSAWIVLLAAGVLGIVRMEWTPTFYYLGSRKARTESLRQRLQAAQLSGERSIFVDESGEILKLADLLATADETLGHQDRRLNLIQRRQRIMYVLIRIFLITGFLLLLVARGVGPATDLLDPAISDSQPSFALQVKEPSEHHPMLLPSMLAEPAKPQTQKTL